MQHAVGREPALLDTQTRHSSSYPTVQPGGGGGWAAGNSEQRFPGGENVSYREDTNVDEEIQDSFSENWRLQKLGFLYAAKTTK